MPWVFFVSVSETRSAGPVCPGIIASESYCGLFGARGGRGTEEEGVGTGWGQGTAEVPSREKLLRSPLCGCAAKWWLFMLLRGYSHSAEEVKATLR